MMNILNGGVHADNPIDFQEFMIMPLGAPSLREAVRWGSEVFQTLKGQLKKAGLNTNVGDEGGFAPNLPSAEAALDYCVKAIEAAGFKPGEDIALGARPAPRPSSSRTAPMSIPARARPARSRSRSTISPSSPTPIRSSRSRTASPRTTGRAGSSRPTSSASACSSSATTCSSPTSSASARGIKEGVANSILIKVNQIGTLTETLAAVDMAHRAGYTAVMSHRSGETEDSTIADLAVATNCGQIKTGSLARSDRLAKYNQLIRIEEELGDQARYAGRAAIKAR